MPRHTTLVVALSFLMALGFSASLAEAAAGDVMRDSAAGLGAGAAALSGNVLTVDGAPLPNVLITDGKVASTRTDAQGHFLLRFVPAGKSILRIDGRHGGMGGGIDYGTYEVQVTAAPNRVTALPFTSWLTPIDHANDIVIPSPTTGEIVARTPRLPGLELRIPAGTIITDWDGKRINRISLTPVKADRPPFPLPREVMFADYFTAQPGGAKLWTLTGARAAAKVIYPNRGNGLPGTSATFWHYHPQTVGWLPYGSATVSPDGKSIIPDDDATFYDFMGGGNPSDNTNQANKSHTNQSAGCSNCPSAGDPIDLASGLYTESMTDLTIADVVPITLTRSYISSDTSYRDFGLGMSLSYEMFPSLGGGSSNTEASEEYSQFTMNTPTSSVVFNNITPAYGNYSDALFAANNAPGPFLSARAIWTGNGFEVTRRDGAVYAFGYHRPLTYVQDRFGNRVTLSYEQVGGVSKPVKVTSPNGRFIQFSWTNLYPGGVNNGYAIPTGLSSLYVITQAVDNLGRQTNYNYDACGRLISVESANAVAKGQSSTLTTIAWTTSAAKLGSGSCPNPATTSGTAPLNLLYTITDPLGHLVVKNDQYEWTVKLTGGGTSTSSYNCESLINGSAPTATTTGRVCHQTAPPTYPGIVPSYSFKYTVDANDNITNTTVTEPTINTTNPVAHIHLVNFLVDGEQCNIAQAAPSCSGALPPQYSVGFPASESYALALSDIQSQDANQQTWAYARDPATFTLLSVTAPLLSGESAGRVTAYCYDNTPSTSPSPPLRPWNLTSVVRNLTSSGTACPSAVQSGSTTANATTLFTYSPTYNLMTSVTDPNGNTTTFCRTSAQTNCGITSNPLEEALSVIDANSNSVSFTYAPNGQVQTTSQVATSSQTLQTDFGYDHSDLVSITAVATDVASRTSTIYTDAVGRPIQKTDPLGDITTIAYDPIFGPTQITDPNQSYESFTYNSDGTVSTAAQPKGSMQFAYSQANLVTTTTDPLSNQSLNFYDESGNLTCMIDRKGNQANFTYDYLNRRTMAIYYIGNTSGCTGTPGSTDSTVSYGYDQGNRLLTITDSAGGTLTRQYDDLDRLTSDTQTAAGSGAAIGNSSYTYDIGSRLTVLSPSNATAQTYFYDPANRLIAITHAGNAIQPACMTYDLANRRTALVFPSSATANYSWDSVSDLAQISYDKPGSYTPGSGSAPGTCTPGTATNAGSGSLTYAFDQDGRQVNRGSTAPGNSSFVGFQLVLPPAFAASTVAFNADNQMTLWSGLSNIYDGNGNLTCTGSTSSTSCSGAQSQALAYDARNRLTSAAGVPGVSGAAETYIYDGLSRRQSVSVASAATKATYLYDGLNPLSISTINTTSGTQLDATNIFVGRGVDERLQINSSSNASASGIVLSDSQGSILELESGTTNNVSFTYPAFGSTGSTTSPNTFRYTGREASDNTQLYYYRGRYYSPTLSRFIQEDPLGLSAGPNIYAYANNDPINLLDPYGLAACGGSLSSLSNGQLALLGLAILGTEIAGGGPLDPAADAAVVGEISAAEGLGAAETAGGSGTQILVNSAGDASVTIQGEELSIHAATQATIRGISLDDISAALGDGTSFSYVQNGQTLTGYYEPLSNTFVGVGNRITTVINPSNPSNYLLNLLGRGP